MSKDPNYLVQTADGVIHAYWSADILLCDLAINRGEQVRIYEKRSGIKLSYSPIDETQLREETLRSKVSA